MTLAVHPWQYMEWPQGLNVTRCAPSSKQNRHVGWSFLGFGLLLAAALGLMPAGWAAGMTVITVADVRPLGLVIPSDGGGSCIAEPDPATTVVLPVATVELLPPDVMLPFPAATAVLLVICLLLCMAIMARGTGCCCIAGTSLSTAGRFTGDDPASARYAGW